MDNEEWDPSEDVKTCEHAEDWRKVNVWDAALLCEKDKEDGSIEFGTA